MTQFIAMMRELDNNEDMFTFVAVNTVKDAALSLLVKLHDFYLD